ncbi:MAG: hypothetical protein K6G40_05325 [Eubacterium sp.]|nr:hypothetical protein [Eubacterium sp.]
MKIVLKKMSALIIVASVVISSFGTTRVIASTNGIEQVDFYESGYSESVTIEGIDYVFVY